MSDSWFKFKRSRAAEELIKDPKAWALLSLIAYRVRRTDSFNIKGLNPGEALIGDHEACGQTRSEYRATIKRLVNWQFVTIKTTSKGTIAKLINSDIFDINIEDNDHQNDHQTTIKQSSSDHPTTTNKNVKNVKNEKNIVVGENPPTKNGDKKKSFTEESIEYQLASHLLKRVLEEKPNLKKPNLQAWAKKISTMLRDKHRTPLLTPERTRAAIDWIFDSDDDFWRNVIQSPSSLDNNFDKIEKQIPAPKSAKEKERDRYE